MDLRKVLYEGVDWNRLAPNWFSLQAFVKKKMAPRVLQNGRISWKEYAHKITFYNYHYYRYYLFQEWEREREKRKWGEVVRGTTFNGGKGRSISYSPALKLPRPCSLILLVNVSLREGKAVGSEKGKVLWCELCYEQRRSIEPRLRLPYISEFKNESKSKSELCHYRRSVGQSVLVSSPIWGPRPDFC
jgi:hypothetical protein